MTLLERVAAKLGEIPAGEVRTYRQLSEALGFRAARHAQDIRTVVLRLVHDQTRLTPWWRVVGNDGRLLPGSETIQRAMLVGEQVAFAADGKVELRDAAG